MTFITADNLSLAIFSSFSLIMFCIIVFMVVRTAYRPVLFLVLFVSYLALFMGIVQSGLAVRYILPVFPLMFLSVVAVSLLFSFSKYGQRISNHYSLAVIIGFQCFRLPLELILHHWAEIGTVPPTMTWTGQNWDVITGITSLISIPFVDRSKPVAWLVSILGFVLLLNVIRVVIMSSPFPFAWPLANPIQLIGHLPYALIGPLFVGAALAGHVIAFRKLRSLSSLTSGGSKTIA